MYKVRWFLLCQNVGKSYSQEYPKDQKLIFWDKSTNEKMFLAGLEKSIKDIKKHRKGVSKLKNAFDLTTKF